MNTFARHLPREYGAGLSLFHINHLETRKRGQGILTTSSGRSVLCHAPGFYALRKGVFIHDRTWYIFLGDVGPFWPGLHDQA